MYPSYPILSYVVEIIRQNETLHHGLNALSQLAALGRLGMTSKTQSLDSTAVVVVFLDLQPSNMFDICFYRQLLVPKSLPC